MYSPLHTLPTAHPPHCTPSPLHTLPTAHPPHAHYTPSQLHTLTTSIPGTLPSAHLPHYVLSPSPSQLEQEVEHIREAHTILEASTAKREQLEMAMRRKLEAELRKAREANLQLKGTNKQSSGHLSHMGKFHHPLGPNVHFCSKMSPAVWTTTMV